MITVNIQHDGIPIQVPTFLVANDLWPYQLPLQKWPTYCGAGEGLGDYVVPDHIFGVSIAMACFIHDCEYAVNDRNWLSFCAANDRLRRNIKSIVDAKLDAPECIAGHAVADEYFLAVMTFGWPNFTPDAPVEKWFESKILKEKLHRLAMADLNHSDCRN